MKLSKALSRAKIAYFVVIFLSNHNILWLQPFFRCFPDILWDWFFQCRSYKSGEISLISDSLNRIHRERF